MCVYVQKSDIAYDDGTLCPALRFLYEGGAV